MEKIKCKLEFRQLNRGENLYDNVDLDARSIVEAQYRKIMSEEHNPDLCALPKTPTTQEIIDLGMIQLPGYDHDLVAKMSKAERLEMIEDIDRVMTPLGIHIETARVISQLLTRSYKYRDVMVSSNDDEGVYGRDGFGCNIVSIPRLDTPNPIGFFLHGKTGCGKTMAVQLVSRMYPRVIRHTFDNYSYVQIPIIMVTALQKSIRDVFRSMATIIDNLLDAGDFHERKVRNANISAIEGYVKSWIQNYHIGLIIVDEVQFLDFSVKNKTIEDIVTITQATGCQFGLIGNNDAKDKVFGYDRLHRRVAKHIIDADMESKNNIRLFEHAIDTLWKYQWTDVYSSLTEEIKNLLMYESARNISLLKYIVTKIQLDAVMSKFKDVIDESFISDHIGKDMEALRDKLADPADKDDAEYTQYLARLYARISADVSSETEIEKGRLLEMMAKGELTKARESVRNAAFNSIVNTSDYSDSFINRAIKKVIDADPEILDHPPKILTRKTLEVLKEATKTVKRKETTAVNKAARGTKNPAEVDKETRQVLAALKVTGVSIPVTE